MPATIFRDFLAAETLGVFIPTNINLCLYQQFSLFERWWCPVEATHKCGFSARILMSPTCRAIIHRDTGLQDPGPVQALFQTVWAYTADSYGPQSAAMLPLMRISTAAQRATRAFYYDLHEEEEKAGWGSACKAALGKMEYHIPSAALLAALAASALGEDVQSSCVSDEAVKCAARHYDLRVFQSCAVVDCTVSRQQPPAC